MKLIFDISAVQSPLTGIGRYALNLAHGTELNPAVEEVKLFSSQGWVDNIDSLYDELKKSNTSKNNIKLALRRKVPFNKLARRAYRY